MKRFINFKPRRSFLFSIIFLLSFGSIFLVLVDRGRIANLNQAVESLNTIVRSLNTNLSNLTKENNALKKEESKTKLKTFDEIVEKYELVKAKAAKYKSQGLKVEDIEKELAKIPNLIFAKKFSEADASLTKSDNALEKLYQDWQAANAAATASQTSTCVAIPTSGHCQLSIKTSNGTFTTDIVAINISQATATTVTANSSDCSKNCPAKSLLSYVQDNSAFAGIHGTYFCPPDYASCADKVNTYDFPVYNSNLKKWLNEGILFWSGRAMMAFTSSGVSFYPQANTYSTLPGLQAAIVNFPGLVHNGSNIVNNYSLTSAQLTKGFRGGIGVKGSTVYLVIAQSATVKDFAAVMMAIGTTHALNLDGGGSSALIYQGSYKVGPGRLLPNAVVFK